MGINFYTSSMTVQNRSSWYYSPDFGENTAAEAEESEDLEIRTIKFNDLMKDDVSSQLNTILARGNRAFTDKMLGLPDSGSKKILDVRA